MTTAPQLRTYQHDAVEAVFKEWEQHHSTMIVMATGLGKTVTFCEVIRRLHPARAIIIAHRTELIQQACAALERIGIRSEIEMAENKADASMFFGESTIVASVQSLISGRKDNKRMTKFRPQDFSLLVIDEAHRAVADSFRSVITHFRKNPNLKVLLVTATPERYDSKALGLVCDSVAYKYDIAEGIEDGWLVPIEQQMIRVGSLDYSHVRTTAGDLNGADLAKIMEDEKNLQGMVGASIEIIGDRPSIAFTSSVRHAEMCCDIFNRHKPGMAAWVSGTTPSDDRARIFKAFRNGETQIIANVGIITEGTDLPRAEVAIMGRPTASRGLYTQMVGRILRPVPGIIDGLTSAYERREAIASSHKGTALVLDFVGNSGKHKLVCTADILGGKYDEEVVKQATEEAQKSQKPAKMSELLKQIKARIERQKAEEAARKARLVAKVQYTKREISPFDAFDIKPRQDSKWDTGRPLSSNQRAVLQKMGVNPDELNYAAAKQLLIEHFKRREKGLCTLKQAQCLARAGINAKKVTFDEASRMIDQLKKNNFDPRTLVLV